MAQLLIKILILSETTDQFSLHSRQEYWQVKMLLANGP